MCVAFPCPGRLEAVLQQQSNLANTFSQMQSSTPLPSFQKSAPSLFEARPQQNTRSINKPYTNISQDTHAHTPYQPQPNKRANPFSVSSANPSPTFGSGNSRTPSNLQNSPMTASNGASFQTTNEVGMRNQMAPTRNQNRPSMATPQQSHTAYAPPTRTSPPQQMGSSFASVPQSLHSSTGGHVAPSQNNGNSIQASSGPPQSQNYSFEYEDGGGAPNVNTEDAVADAIRKMKEAEKRKKEERKRKREEEEMWARTIRAKLEEETNKVDKLEQFSHDSNRELYALFNDLQCISHE